MYITVKFRGTPYKEYIYKLASNVKLESGKWYRITVKEGTYTYENPIIIVRGFDDASASIYTENCKTIIKAVEIPEANSRKKIGIKKVIFNKEKRTTVVVWNSGDRTKVICAEGDEWDEEKALALCVLKHICGDKSYYNDYLREWISGADRH